MAVRTPPAIDPRDYLPMVRGMANRLAGRGLDVDDLVQAGLIGLMEAAGRYDPAGPASLKTYARHRVRGAMLNAIRDQGRTVRVPRDLYDAVNAGRTGGRFDDARRALRASFSGDHDRDEDSSLADLAVDARDASGGPESPEYVASLLDEMPEREAEIVRRCVGMYGPPQSPESVAHSLGDTAEAVLGVFNEAMRRLRLRAENLERPQGVWAADAAEQVSKVKNEPGEEKKAMSRSPGANGRPHNGVLGQRTPKVSPKKRQPGPAAGTCPACGYLYGKRPWCYNASCEHYRFRKGYVEPARARPLPAAKADKGSRVSSPALDELRVMFGCAELMETLPGGDARGRALAWLGSVYLPARR